MGVIVVDGPVSKSLFDRLVDLFRRDFDDPGTLLVDQAFDTLDAEWESLAKLPPPTLIEKERGESLTKLADLRSTEKTLGVQIHDLQNELRQVVKVIRAEELRAAALADEKAANITPIRNGKMKEAAE